MLLKAYLKKLTKVELAEFADGWGMEYNARLRKSELMEKLSENFCSEDFLRFLLAHLTKQDLALFRQACDEPREVLRANATEAFRLVHFDIAYMDKGEEHVFIYEDVAEAFRKIDDAEFQKEQEKRGWLMSCLRFFVRYYGLAPLEVIHDLYGKRVKCDMEEMVKLIGEVPVTLMDVTIFPAEELGMDTWPEWEPLRSERGVLADVSSLDFANDLFALMLEQVGEPFFVPSSAEELEEIMQSGYELTVPQYQKLLKYLVEKIEVPYEDAALWCEYLWDSCSDEKDDFDILDELDEADIAYTLVEEKKLDKLVDEARNHTRMPQHRGHMPYEVKKRKKSPVETAKIVQQKIVSMGTLAARSARKPTLPWAGMKKRRTKYGADIIPFPLKPDKKD